MNLYRFAPYLLRYLLLCCLSAYHLFAFSQSSLNPTLEKTLEEAKLLDKEEKFEESAKLYQQVLTQLTGNEHHETRLICYNALARGAGIQSRFAEEKQYLIEAFEYGKKHHILKEPYFAKTYERRGEHYEETGFFKKSFDDFSTAQELFMSNSNSPESAKNHQFKALGRISAMLGDHIKAGDYYEKSLEANRKLFGEESNRVAADYNVLGVNREKLGDFGKAKEYQEASLRIYRRLGRESHSKAADSYNNLGNAHFYLGNFAEAEKNYRRSLNIYQQRLGRKSLRVAYATMNIGIIYAVQGNFEEALHYFDQERALKQEIFGGPHPDLIYSYNNLAAAYQRMGKNDKSLEMYMKANEIAESVYPERHPILAKTYEDISFAYQMRDDIDKSLDYMQKNLIAGSQHFSSSNIEENPETTDFLDPANRLRSLREKVKLIEKKSRKDNSNTSYLQMALAQTSDGIDLLDFMRSGYKAEESKTYWQKGGNIFFEKGLHLAYDLWQAEQDPSYIDQAFELMGRNKSLLLLASVMENKGKKFAGISEQLLYLEDSLKQEINFYEKLIANNPDSLLLADYEGIFFKRKESYDSLLLVFEKTYPLYHKLKYSTQTTGIAALQNELLTPGSFWLEYFVGDTSMFALLIGTDSKQLIKLSSPKQLSSNIEALRKNIYGYFLSTDPTDSLFKATKEAYISHAHELYTQLIAPVFDDLSALPERLTIVPDGSLGYLPFDLLLREKTEATTNFADLPYLIKTSCISYSYSATLLHEMREGKRETRVNNEVLVVAPEFASSDLAYNDIESLRREGLGALLYNQKEASNIQAIIGGKMLSGAQATQANFLSNAASYSMIHFATHGKVNTQNADLSYLALAAQDTGSRELLYVNDLYSMNIPAEMVVLSACETGLGNFKAGDGIASLSRAFSYAGAQSIIPTLWSVNDQKTAEFMEQFYQNIATGMPKDVSLQQAKLAYLNSQDNYYTHPFFWGASIPVGYMAPIDSGMGFWTMLLIGLGILLMLVGIYVMFGGIKKRIEHGDTEARRHITQTGF